MTTTNTPPGAELDRRTAEALWPGGDLEHPEHPAHRVGYSTDHALIPELLAWLRAELSDEVYGDLFDEVVVVMKADHYDASVIYDADEPKEVGVSGTTIPHALCLLILAVSKEATQ